MARVSSMNAISRQHQSEEDLHKITSEINQETHKQLQKVEDFLEEPQSAIYVGSVCISTQSESEWSGENQIYASVESDPEEGEVDTETEHHPETAGEPENVYIQWQKRATNKPEGQEYITEGEFPSLYITKFGNVKDLVVENSKKRLTEISSKIGLQTTGEYFLDEEEQGIHVVPGFIQYNVKVRDGTTSRRIYFTSYSLKNTGQTTPRRMHDGPLFVFVTSPPFCQTLLKPKIVSVFSTSFTERGFISIMENDTHLVACELAKLGYDCLSVDPVGADNVPSFYLDFLYKYKHNKFLQYLATSSPEMKGAEIRRLNVRDVMAINSIIKFFLKNPEGAIPLHPNMAKSRKLVIVSNLFAGSISNMIRGSSDLMRECSEIVGIDLSESCHPFTSDGYVEEFVKQIGTFCEPFLQFPMDNYNPGAKLREDMSLEFLKMFIALCVGKRSEMIRKIEENSNGRISAALLSTSQIEEEGEKSVAMELVEKPQTVSTSLRHHMSPSSSTTVTLSSNYTEGRDSMNSTDLDTTSAVKYTSFKLLENFHEDDYEITMLADSIKKINMGHVQDKNSQISSLGLKHRDDMFHRGASSKKTTTSSSFTKLKHILDVHSPIETKSHLTNILSGMMGSVNYPFFMKKCCQILSDCLDRRYFESLLNDIEMILQTSDNKIQSISMDAIYSLTNQTLSNKLIDSNGPSPFFDPSAFSGINTQPESNVLTNTTPGEEELEPRKLTVFSFTKMDETDKRFSGSVFQRFIQQLDNYVGFLDCLERPVLVAELLKSLVELKSVTVST